MLVAGVIQHHVHDDADVSLAALLHQEIKIFHCPELGIYRLVVSHIISVVLAW